MPRRRSSSPRPAPRPAPRAASPPPAQRAAAPPPAQQQARAGVLGGLGGMVAQGMALGTGSAMAHRAVDAVLGPRGHAPAPADAAAAAQAIQADNQPCAAQAKAFSECMGLSDGDMEACRVFFDRMRECRLALQ